MISAMPRIAIAMHDYASAVELFSDTLGMPVLDFSDTTVPDLGAHVGMCMPVGGSNVELMSPADPDKPLSQALQRFLDRRGEGFYALMLEAADPNAEADELMTRGVEVLPLMAGAGGRDIHPRSTSGVLIRVYPNGSVTRPDGLESAAPGLSGIERAIVATNDLDTAIKSYRHGLGLAVTEPQTDPERGVRLAVVQPPVGGRIELVEAFDPGRPFAEMIQARLLQAGPGLHAIELTVDDVTAAHLTLTERGLAVGSSATMPGALELNLFGARILLSER